MFDVTRGGFIVILIVVCMACDFMGAKKAWARLVAPPAAVQSQTGTLL